MKLFHIAAAVVLASSLAFAQDMSDAKSKTKLKVEDGKDMTVTGCVEHGADGGYVLTNVANKSGALGSYMLVEAGDHDAFNSLDKHLGHRVEIDGKAADKGNGKIKVETKTEGTSGKTESKSELKGDLKGLPFLGVKSLKMIAAVCP